jgi:magnesium-transporting ATPase (P-type)
MPKNDTRTAAIEDKKDILGRDWHALPPDEALSVLGTDPEAGLSDDEIERRRREFGENRLTPGAERTTLKRFVSQFNNLFIYLLLAAAVITALLGE